MHYGKPLAGKYVRGVDTCCWSPQSFCKKCYSNQPSNSAYQLYHHLTWTTWVRITAWEPHYHHPLCLVNPANSSLGLHAFGRARCKQWPPPLQGSFCTLTCQIILSFPFILLYPMEVLRQFLSFLKFSNADGFMLVAPRNCKCLNHLPLFPMCFRKIMLVATISESSKHCSIRVMLPLSFVRYKKVVMASSYN